MKTLLTCLVSLAITSAALCQPVGPPSPPYGQNKVISRQLRCFVEIDGYKHDGELISGTNCPIHIVAGCRIDESTFSMEWWSHWKVVYLDVTVYNHLLPRHVCSYQDDDFGIIGNFSSTEWPSGTALQIFATAKIHLWSDDGSQSDVILSAAVNPVAFNKGAVLGLTEFEQGPYVFSHGCPHASTALTDTNHLLISDRRGGGWGAPEIESDCQNCTVFYVNTHGGCGGTGAEINCDDNQDETLQTHEDWTNFYPKREAARAAGQPAINFAFFHACHTATIKYDPDGAPSSDDSHLLSNSFLHPLPGWEPGMPFNGYDPPTGVVDRATLGERLDMAARHIQPFSQHFWSSIAQGETVNVARAAGVGSLDLSDGDDYSDDGKVNIDPRFYFAIFGDRHTRLWTAFTADDLPCSTGWYRITYVSGQ